MQQLNMNHNKLERRVSTLEKNDKLSATKEDLKPLNDRMAKLEKNEGATGGSNTATIIREMEDRSRRTNNLVLFNVPENNDADQLTRNAEDTSMVKNICTKHLSISDPFQILKPTRLGKKPANPNLHRPLRVTIPEIQTKNEIQKKGCKNEGSIRQQTEQNSDITGSNATTKRGNSGAPKSTEGKKPTANRRPNNRLQVENQRRTSTEDESVRNPIKQLDRVNNTVKMSTCEGLTCLYSNIDSFLNKREEIQIILQEVNPDIIGFTELKPKNPRYILQHEELAIQGYDCWHSIAGPGRGVMLYTRVSLKAI